MESLETTAETKCSTEGWERNVVQRKGTSEPTATQTKRSPSAEGWHSQSPEGQSRNTCGSSEMSDSGKTQQLQDQQPPQSHATGHHYRELSSYAQQGGQALLFAKQKTGSHLAPAQSLGSCGPAPLRKSPGVPVAPQQHCPPQSGTDLLSEDMCKMEPKTQKPGKYVCDYCGRACAKPSVLKKHIRSHTGERPYPCVPCGFSFKTKSNLYKHRKSHAHLVKAGTVPFSELGSYNANMDQGSFEGEGDLYSDGEQSTDTDEDTLNDLPVLDAAVEEPDSTAVKTQHLIAQKQGVTSTIAEDGSPQLREINASPAIAPVSRAIQSCTIKQRLALRLSEKRSSDTDQSLSLPSQSSKGSTDSGYFSRSESAEHQSGPPNTNAKSYQEIMFGKCYRPSPKQTTVVTCRADSSDYASVEGKRSEKGVSRVFTQEKELVESIKINTRSFTREEMRESQLDPGSDAGPLVRSNSMPTSSAACLSMPQGLRGSHSFDERTSPGGMRRLRRQAAFEHSAHEGHAEPESYGNVTDGALPSGAGGDGFSEILPTANHQKPGLEFATRKRRKEKREEEDLPGPYGAHCDLSEEMFDSARHYESKQVGQGAVGKGPPESVQTQLDRFDMDVSVSSEATGRKIPGNVISVIQHTNSLNRSQSEPYPCQRQEGISSSVQAMKDSETQERANPAEMMGHQLSDCRLDQSYQMAPKLVRQSNIQVPEIRVTVEPDSPEKAPEVQVKELEKHVEEFQWPQRSETLSQFPPEKLPPKKKRLRLADIEHSSGESSFESACTSLSRSPSQDSNLSYSSSFSFDREESFKSASPGRQDEPVKPLELLAVPGSGHSLSILNQRQQHEMRRSSSEQAPCNLRREFPEVRSVSFDYGSLSPTSKVRHGELSSMKDQSQGDLVRQESLTMDPEFTQVLPHMIPQYLSSALLSQTLPIFATGNAYPQLSHSGLLVPVRIQTHVPSFGSITYTSVSRILDAHHDSVSSTTGFSQSIIEHARALSTDPHTVQILDLSLAKLKTGIPLSLTSRTISTTNASSGGSNKRLLSPASSLDLFMEVKQQKRVKEEKMFGQIVEELSAVELGNCNVAEENRHMTEILSTSSQHSQDDPQRGSIISKQQIATGSPDGAESAMDSSHLESGARPYSTQSISDFKEVSVDDKVKMDMVAQLVRSQDVPISDGKDPKVLSQFPSLRTTTAVSWCYLNYTKPSSSHDTPFSSVYATWCVSSHNPNPPDLSTSATLALLHSKQKRDTCVYTMAAMYQPGTGKLVSSLLLWRQRLEQLQRKPDTKDVDIPYGRKAKDGSCRGKTVKEDWKEREACSKQAVPTRIKIFEGGYKSNEDYVYVRGRGRGKYICEECGIRCKKPSMLKKHIRTHTDVRPYVCRVCNFAFKTKGNLTKHMKSKAHMKKCLELGVSVTVEDAEIQESDDIQQELKTGRLSTAKHQFSDADDSDGMDEEIDEIDEDEDEDDEYEGDSTPKVCSRSSSPQPCGVASLSVTATAVIHGCSFTALPGVEVHYRASGRRVCADRRTVLAAVDPEQRERLVDEDSLNMLSPDHGCFPFDPYPSCLLSPGWESPLREPSPSRLRYPSPRRELSSRGRSSPRWDASPLRPSSPNLISVQHLSPASMERPLSPGAELTGKREPSVRGRQRVVLRAVSPRRGSYQHRGASWEKTRQQAMAEQLISQQGAIEMELDRGISVPQPGPATSPQSQNLLSHLPLHSQQQTQSLLPVVPIGGIQVRHSLPSPSPCRSLSPVMSLQTGGSQGGSTTEGSLRAPESREEDSARQQNRPSPQQTAKDSQENPPSLSIRDSKQEENVQTCMQAIASLRITSEESK